MSELRRDPWQALRAHTAARIALGRSGDALPTSEHLALGLAHAQARDAVHVPLDDVALAAALERSLDWPVLRVQSAAPDRPTYLRRPDLGRRLADASAQALDAWRAAHAEPFDLLVVVGDGLSSRAVTRNAEALLEALRRHTPTGWTLGPLVLATQARVALGDDIGARLHAPLGLMIVGERPGLSSADGLGLYLTWRPHVGRHDAQRNCISNVRPDGLPPEQAATRAWWLCQAARRQQLSGVDLKDESDARIAPRLEPD